ncbi:response regulator transcription factor [bacterium]|nr:response regulator transcription factor [bacterium]
MIRILLLEDQHLLREGMKLVLEGDPQLRVSAQADTGGQALQLLEQGEFDLFVLDLSLPDMDGTECLRQRRRQVPALVVSMHESQTIVAQALAAGALGYVLKTASPEQLRQACREVAAGGRHLQPGLLQSTPSPAAAAGPLLTPAERQLLQRVGRGHGWEQLQQELGLSPATLESRVRGLCRKLQQPDLQGAYGRAVELQLILPNPHGRA